MLSAAGSSSSKAMTMRCSRPWLPNLAKALLRSGVGEAAASFTRYRLAYALDRDGLDGLVRVAAPASLP